VNIKYGNSQKFILSLKLLIRLHDTDQKLSLTCQMTIKVGNVYFTITSQTTIENSTNPISAAAVQKTLSLNICNNIKLKIHLYCKGLQTERHRMPCLD